MYISKFVTIFLCVSTCLSTVAYCRRKPNPLRDDYRCHRRSVPDNKAWKLCRKIMKENYLQKSFDLLKSLEKKFPSQCPTVDEPICPKFTDEYLKNAKTSQARSLSPYENHITCDNNRKPRYIAEKRCLCVGCIDENGNETFQLSSRKINMKINVMKRDTQGKWKKEKEKVVVGCTCVKPITYHQP